jgi:hypothetical protein
MVGCIQMIRVARVLVVCAFAGALAGCGSDSDFVTMGGLLWDNVSRIGSEGPPVPRNQAAAVPYASIGIRYGSSPEAMLILATKSGSDSEWLAGTQFSIVTRDGRIIRTVGLPHNLTGFQGPIADSGSDATPGSYHYLYDFSERHVFGAIVECAQHDAGPERIEIIGGSHDTRHIVEECTAPQFGWQFQNDFWRDAATGYVWKTMQIIYPDDDPVTISVLRPEQ